MRIYMYVMLLCILVYLRVYLRRFHQVLKALADSEEAQIVMLKAIHELWHTHQQASPPQLCLSIDCTCCTGLTHVCNGLRD